MEGKTTLIDLKTAVFQAVPVMLVELDESVEMKAVCVDPDVDEASLAAFGPGGARGYRGRA